MRISDWSSDVCSSDLVHVAVRADAGIAEQVPGAAQIGAALDERKAAVGAVHLQMHRHADARNARADDQHVLIDGGGIRLHAAVEGRRACHHIVSQLYLASAYA